MKNTFHPCHWVFLALLLSSCAGPPSSAQENPVQRAPSQDTQSIGRPPSDQLGKQNDNYAEGQVIVRFVEGTSKEAIEVIMRELNLEIIRSFSFPDLYLMRICDRTPVKTVVERLQGYPAVKYAEPDYAVRTQ